MLPWLPKKDLFALDLGTTKFCIASLLQKAKQSDPSLEITSVEANGMRRGMVVDVNQASKALTKLLDLSERQLGWDIHRVVVGISGSHLDSFRCRASIPLNTQMVNQSHLLELAVQVEAQNLRDDKELLHAIPISYQIDQRPKVHDPINFSGQMLHGEFLLIFADRHYLKDVIRLCNQSGVQVASLFAEPVASASVTLTEEFKARGIAVVDIGGGTSDGIVFQNGKPQGVFTLNVAGQMMTNDLALGLQVPHTEAERIKIFFGLCPDDSNQSLEIKTIYGESKLIVWRDVFQILGPRVRELGSLMVRSLYQYKGCLSAGVLLTGGGANVKGIGSYLSDQLRVPISVCTPSLSLGDGLKTSFATPAKKNFHSKYATALGLMNLQICKMSQPNPSKTMIPNKYLNQFFNWLKELS